MWKELAVLQSQFERAARIRHTIAHLEFCLSEIETDLGRISSAEPPSGMFELDEKKVRRLLAVRRVREKHLGPGLFADPAWDILLEALASDLGKKEVSVSDLCRSTPVPESTAQRWIQTLEMDGWLRRCGSSDEGRDIVELTSKGSIKLRLFFEAVAPGLVI